MNIWHRYLQYIRNNPEGYWFRRKLYGWGWTPALWQGWLVTAFIVGLIVLNAARIDGASHSVSDILIRFIPQTILLIVMLIAICYRTGEPPKWQWGFPEDNNSENK